MVKTIHLVRHGHHALLAGVLCGRMPAVELDALGCRQMSACAAGLLPAPTVIQSSPQRRALQSAEIFARHLGLPVEIVGPTPAFYARRGKNFYYQIVAKAKDRDTLLQLAKIVPQDWTIDLDPADLL